MKKSLTVILLILMLGVVFSGCWWNKKKDESQITSIEDAMKSGKGMKCTYNISDNEASYNSVMWVQGDKYKTEFDQNGNKTYSMFDGNMMYSWPIEDGKGYKIDKSCLEDIEKSASESNVAEDFSIDETFTTEDDFDTAINVKCEYSDVDLSLPGNIEFIDQCQLMKDAINAFENLEEEMSNFNFD